MGKIKVIKNEQDYQEALALLHELMLQDPDAESTEGEQLAILGTLISDYESNNFPIDLPSPVDAIRFCMDQRDLKPQDLVPYIGSKSRVSEILSGKRKLTLEMIRALESGLGIPAKVLLQDPIPTSSDSFFQDWSPALLKEMRSRGCFDQVENGNIQDLLSGLFRSLNFSTQIPALLRQSSYRSAPSTDKKALAAWMACVLMKAKKISVPTQYQIGSLDVAFMAKLAQLSIHANGPILAVEELKKIGIVVVVEEAFPKTRLDGAAIFSLPNTPVIGLTLRHDRLDNFWFTLMHELAHVALHRDSESEVFFDELDGIKGLQPNLKEQEADVLASEALVPEKKWEISPAKLVPSTLAANSLAKEIGVHVAIVAGKIRFAGNQYKYLNKVVGEAKVRALFGEE